jgi:hypothetical protein
MTPYFHPNRSVWDDRYIVGMLRIQAIYDPNHSKLTF